ncbi:unnamed protein product [Rotaria socialis]|uniref:Uncharacterized protein n=1 Tax=Rotaria socialis TaxID=392032 RepID=A0A820P385_9BILA|nr:unnamed protein product [Rotaria socialis]
MPIKDIPSSPSSKSDVQNREWYSVWSRFHPLIVIPYWSVVFVLMIIVIKSLGTQNGAARVWAYIMIIAVLFTLLCLITRAFEYLLDVFSNETKEEIEVSHFSRESASLASCHIFAICENSLSIVEHGDALVDYGKNTSANSIG